MLVLFETIVFSTLLRTICDIRKRHSIRRVRFGVKLPKNERYIIAEKLLDKIIFCFRQVDPSGKIQKRYFLCLCIGNSIAVLGEFYLKAVKLELRHQYLAKYLLYLHIKNTLFYKYV